MATLFVNHTKTHTRTFVQMITPEQLKRFHDECSAMPGIHVAVLAVHGVGDDINVLAVSHREIDAAAATRAVEEVLEALVKAGQIELIVPDRSGGLLQ